MPELTAKQRIVLFCAVPLCIGLSFFSRHIAGMIYTHWHYSCLVYNPESVRRSPPAAYDFLPDDVSWDETRAYARWTNEVIRGELGGATLASFAPYLTTDVPREPFWLRDRLGPMILAGIALLPASDVRTSFLIADLIFPIGLALALVLLCWEMSRSVSFAVAATSVVMFFNWQDLLNLIAFFRGAPQNGAIFLRTPYPQFSAILFCLFLLSLFRLVQEPAWSRLLVFALLLWLNFFTYFYSWTYALMFVGASVLLLATTLMGSSLESIIPLPEKRLRALLGLVSGTGVCFLLAFPVWWGIIRKTPGTNDTFLRLGGTFTHAPELRYTTVLLILAIVLLGWRTCRWGNRWFAVIFLMASLLVMNIQVITGTTIQPGHWTGYYIQPLFLLFFFDFLWTLELGRNSVKIRSAVAGALLTAGIATNVYKLSVGAEQAVGFNRRDPAFEQVLDLFRQPSLRSYGFLSNDDYLSTVLPAYVTQKPLRPWYMDPETDGELASLRRAALQALSGEPASSGRAPGSNTGVLSAPTQTLTLVPNRILFVLNRHRLSSDSLAANRQVLLRNEDFLVLAPLAGPR